MERNWLIRTSQNQILGPVAKQKLMEFIQKGALGMLDEVSSGNGYWFSLKEKDLVEKYLNGDLPQSYNPISESRSVLSKQDNPDKTTSINSAPANSGKIANDNKNATQIIKLDFDSFNAPSPKKTELDFAVNKNSVENDSNKLPNNDDLEFPDVDLIASSVSASFENGDLALQSSLTSAKIPMPIPKHPQSSGLEFSSPSNDMVLPKDDDLAFPDLDDVKTSPNIDKGMVDLSHQYTRTVALDARQTADVLPTSESSEEDDDNLSFEVTSIIKTYNPAQNEMAQELEDANQANIAAANAEGPLKLDRHNVKASGLGVISTDTTNKNRANTQNEDKKLLHDRKSKSSSNKGAALRDPNRESHHKDINAVPQKRNDTYLFFILVILVLIILAIFFYFKEILNKPLPM